jgi:hypothetical protein
VPAGVRVIVLMKNKIGMLLMEAGVSYKSVQSDFPSLFFFCFLRNLALSA